MGRIVVSNNPDWIDNFERDQNNAGMKLNTKISGLIDVLVFHKLKDKNYNYFCSQNGNEDFVATSGTIIYKGKFGADALPILLEDLSCLSIKEIRKQAMGNYFILYRVNGVLSGFTDEMGTYSIYYYSQDGCKDFILTNTYYHVPVVPPK